MKIMNELGVVLYDDANGPTQTWSELLAQRDTLVSAIQAMLNELGVPDDNYPAPVANAIFIGRSAINGHREAINA